MMPAMSQSTNRPTRSWLTNGTWLSILSLAMALAVTGCKKEAKKTDESATDDQNQAGKTSGGTVETEPGDNGAGGTDATKPAGKPTIKLLNTGAEPRHELRYKLDQGHKENVVMIITMAMQMDMPGAPSTPVQMPPMKMLMALEVTEKISDDQAKYTFAVTGTDVEDSPGADPMVAQALKTSIANVVGMKGSALVDTRGFNEMA